MLARVLLVIALLVGGYFFLRRFRGSPWLARAPQWLAAAGVTGFLLLLTARGGGEIAVPLLAALVPLLLRGLNAKPLSSSAPPAASQGRSAINTRFLAMTLDHATGIMSGTVREGRFAGCELRDLEMPALLELWRTCQPDPQSLAVLEAYLDRHADPGWRDQLEQSERSRQTVDARWSGPRGRAEAYQILGLQAGADRDEIQSAYRRLIQRVHPDQGGSAYLAACLNRARDFLVADLEKD
ncbi:MAG TPA: DnaJ domain-containing protein [Rhodocyclaceae bacterium]|nr:DnaJ domain-containing protein [Rhodocyclaceae bacterium]